MHKSFKEYLMEHSGISETEYILVSKEFRMKSFSKKEIILQEGEICKEGFYVEKGLLRAYTIDHQGKEHIIQFASEGWFVADRSSMYLNEGSMMNIDAVEATEVICFTPDIFAKLSQEFPKLTTFNEGLLHKHIASLQFRINQLLSATAEERYRCFVDLYPDLMLRVPQWMIASYLGITPESLSRVRKELAERYQRKSL